MLEKAKPSTEVIVEPTEEVALSMDLARVSTADLLNELARGLTMAASQLYRLGQIWIELERRGADMSDLRAGLNWTLPLIGSGLLAAESVIAFAGQKAILKSLEGVPLETQRRLAAGDKIEVVLPDTPGTVESVPIRRIPAWQLGAVFADGEILPPAQQRLRLTHRRRRHTREGEEERERRYRPRYDREAGTVQVGRMSVRLADLLSELSAAAGPDHPPADIAGEFIAVKTRLSHDESRRLIEAARKAGLPEWEMIRKAMRAFGLI